jgi:hypothetical protein
MAQMRRRLVLALLVTGAGLLAACHSPTLPPLPPPSEPQSIEHVGGGQVLLEGTLPVEQAKLLVLNYHTDEITGVFTRDGAYSLVVRAEPGDFMELWYSTLGFDSPTARFEIPELDPELGDEDEPAPAPSLGGNAEPPTLDGGTETCACE